ncbi:tetratricopeptide repeat protein [Variovorax sp. OV329]|uniref:tetratricopeptide repeat protein n=1 Tax=Variovorax sp. OV329 TaxID=1882825 RepID=UPI0008E7E921|nr:tetratricopeptide repeat protein [Variovorax sp. OV329]SFL88134.1 TPR repeat [Variovorax sp. OV329]
MLSRLRNLNVILLFAICACSMKNLPRNMSLDAFDPHRKVFVCKYEADAVPSIDAQAEVYFLEGMRLTSPSLWPEDRNYKKAAELWEQAAERRHWKAMLNLADAYASGLGVPRDPERALQIVERAMTLGIPAAYDLMGSFHMNGTGVTQDPSRAFAFWQLAADMGSPSAMAYLGDKLTATYDDPPAFWANRKVGLKMLECGLAQGNGQAAYRLGLTLAGTDKSLDEDNARALWVFHEGVKFGNARCASRLFGAFDDGAPLVMHKKDAARAERYLTIADALRRNPDLRLPNLDKVLPLPPAQLPQWNAGEPSILIDAAKPIIPALPVTPTPGSQRTGRAHIPQGYALPSQPVAPVAEWTETFDRETADIWPQREGATVSFTGYWVAALTESVRDYQQEWGARQTPMRFAKGEVFPAADRQSLGEFARILGVRWHYLGELVRLPEPRPPVQVARGVARMGRRPAEALACWGRERPCPRTGVWEAELQATHPLAKVFHQRSWQTYLEEGQLFPDPSQLHLDIDARMVRWHWIDNANEPGAVGYRVTLSDLHDHQGKALA